MNFTLLIHVYDCEEFGGQFLSEIYTNSLVELGKMIPKVEEHINIPENCQGSAESSWKVMQIIPM